MAENYNTAVAEKWPALKPAVVGNGPYCILARCGWRPTAYLYGTVEERNMRLKIRCESPLCDKRKHTAWNLK